VSRQLATRWLPLWFFCVSVVAVGGDQPRPVDSATEAAPLRLKNLRGEQHSLSDYKGKVVLVNFWASWCGPCITEIPSLRDLYGKMTGEAFEILAVNVKEGPFKVHKFSGLVAMPFPILLDPEGKAFDSWGAHVLPTSFLIDSEGHIQRKVVGPLDWASEEVVAEVRALLPASSATQTSPSPKEKEPVTPGSPAG